MCEGQASIVPASCSPKLPIICSSVNYAFVRHLGLKCPGAQFDSNRFPWGSGSWAETCPHCALLGRGPRRVLAFMPPVPKQGLGGLAGAGWGRGGGGRAVRGNGLEDRGGEGQ